MHSQFLLYNMYHVCIYEYVLYEYTVFNYETRFIQIIIYARNYCIVEIIKKNYF